MNKKEKIIKVVVIGAGGFGREVLDAFDACNDRKIQYDVLGFVVEKEYFTPQTFVNDKPLLGDLSWLQAHKNEVSVVCAVAAPQHRKRIVEQVEKIGCRFCNVVHPGAVMTKWINIGKGIIITAGCILTNQIQIGNHVHINLDCTIGHNATLKDFVTVAPGVHISGNVLLGEGCYVGTGANIIEKKHVGDWSLIGAGCVVVNDVPANTTMVGIPGKVIETREEGWYL